MARAMKLGPCMSEDESYLDLHFMVHYFANVFQVFAFRSFSQTIRAKAMKLGSCIHLEEQRSTQPSIFSLYLLFNGSLTLQIFVECLGFGPSVINHKC